MLRIAALSLALVFATVPALLAEPGGDRPACGAKSLSTTPTLPAGTADEAFLKGLDPLRSAKQAADTSCCTQEDIISCYQNLPDVSCWVGYLGCEAYGYCYCHYVCA